MATHQEIKQAIAILESHRDILEDETMDIALLALRDKLQSLQSLPSAELHQNSTVLVADLSGFTAMSDRMDAEEVRDTIHAVWQKLDSVITAWGGQVDQHVGDGVVALFRADPDIAGSAERAVLAALDMQLELSLFKERERNISSTVLGRPFSGDRLRMRIGIHSGPVLFGKVGTSLHYTAVGDTIALANQLEHIAPVDGILISDAVHNLMEQTFVTEPLPPLTLLETNRHIPIHLVKHEKHHALQDVDRELPPDTIRFIGRSDELAQLQFTLDTALESSSLQIITLLGEAGIGKSRLRMEFEKLLALQPTPVRLFKGEAQDGISTKPYAAIHHMLSNYFDIHKRSSPEVARAKLVEGIVQTLPKEDEHAQERAHFIGHLLGFDFADSVYLKKNVQNNPRRIREYAFQDIARFFTAVTAHGPAVLFLENMEAADEGTLDLLDYLAQTCAEQPLLIICVAQPVLLAKWPICQLHLSTTPHTYAQINLPPLSPIDSRHMIADRLQSIARTPPRLIELLAEAAAGNPFLITELIEMLGEIGVIIRGAKQWRVQLGQLNDMHGRLTLEKLVTKQFERLTTLEQTVLQKASIIGHTFWETAVTHLIHEENDAFTLNQIRAATHTLEQQELIFRNTTSLFPGTVEWRFHLVSLRRAAYTTYSQSQRQADHAHFATWLQNQTIDRSPNYLATIARHLEKAEQHVAAAQWYGRAANLAQNNYTPETTIQYFQHALHMLPEMAANPPLRIQLNEGLGSALRQQARFDKAIVTYTNMQTLALSTGDLAAAARAFHYLFITQNFQGEHMAALATAQQAEKMALANQSTPDLACALAAKGWAYVYLGDLNKALELGKQALSMSAKIASRREMAYSYALLGTINRIWRRFDQAQTTTEKALTLFREIGDPFWESVAFNQLGRIAEAQQDFKTAVSHSETGLQLARNTGDCHSAMRNLQVLSRIAQHHNDFDTAELYLEQTLIWAEKSGNIPFRIYAAADLGRYYLSRVDTAETAVAKGEHLRQARLWLEQGMQLAENAPHSIPCTTVQIEMARLLLAEQSPTKAHSQIQIVLTTTAKPQFQQQGVKSRQLHAAAWRELGNIAVQMPSAGSPLIVNSQPYNIADCYQQSIHILSQLGTVAQPEKAHTQFAWAVYELRWGNHQQGESLWQEAQASFMELGMTKAVTTMERFAL